RGQQDAVPLAVDQAGPPARASGRRLGAASPAEETQRREAERERARRVAARRAAAAAVLAAADELAARGARVAGGAVLRAVVALFAVVDHTVAAARGRRRGDRDQ